MTIDKSDNLAGLVIVALEFLSGNVADLLPANFRHWVVVGVAELHRQLVLPISGSRRRPIHGESVTT